MTLFLLVVAAVVGLIAFVGSVLIVGFLQAVVAIARIANRAAIRRLEEAQRRKARIEETRR